MAKKQKYRLEPLVKIKGIAKRKTEIALARCIRELGEEKVKLEGLERLKKEIIQKRQKARSDMNKKVSSGNSVVRETQVHLGFMRKLVEDEEKVDGEIVEQKEAVQRAEEKLARGRRDYVDAATELNVMEKHRELWEKRQAGILSALENKKMNELAITVHQMNRVRSV